MKNNTQPTLKFYLETIQNYCNEKSKEEIIQLICKYAQEISSEKRAEFLNKFISEKIDLPDNKTNENTNETINNEINLDIDQIMDKIQDLKKEIKNRQESIENGDYYEEHYKEYGERYEYDDEDIDYISDEQSSEIEHYFEIADTYFLSWNLQSAKKIYKELLGWLASDSNKLDFIYDINEYIGIDFKETRARYLRSIYETTLEKNKIKEIIPVLDLDVIIFERRYNPNNIEYPTLRDICESFPWNIENWKEFIKELKEPLENKTTNRAFILLLELIDELEWIDSVTIEVRKKQIPIGYLYLLNRLIDENNWNQTKFISEEALNSMENCDLRQEVAKILTKTWEKLENNEIILNWKRETFHSVINDSNFSLLLEEAVKQDRRDIELKSAFLYLNKSNDEKYKSLKIKILFMLGDIDKAYEIVWETEWLWWSYSWEHIAVFTLGILITLIKSNKQASILHSLFRNSCNLRDVFYEIDDWTKPMWIIIEEVKEWLSKIDLSQSQKQNWFNFADKIVDKRIDWIVSNKYRRSYDKAAKVLWAMMEVYILSNDKLKALKIYNNYRNEKFNRFPAFKREVDSAIESSQILRENINNSL